MLDPVSILFYVRNTSPNPQPLLNSSVLNPQSKPLQVLYRFICIHKT